MKATDIEIQQVLIGYKEEMDLFVNKLYEKRLNILLGLKEMDLTTITVFDKAFGKEMFYTAVQDLYRENEINDLLND
ncbi:MAG: hypothetical protein V4608_14975 [Bacteroidota bacterium]